MTVAIRKIAGTDRDYLASARKFSGHATYFVYFQDNLWGAVALHNFAPDAAPHLGPTSAPPHLRIVDQELFFRHPAVITRPPKKRSCGISAPAAAGFTSCCGPRACSPLRGSCRLAGFGHPARAQGVSPLSPGVCYHARGSSTMRVRQPGQGGVTVEHPAVITPTADSLWRYCCGRVVQKRRSHRQSRLQTTPSALLPVPLSGRWRTFAATRLLTSQ